MTLLTVPWAAGARPVEPGAYMFASRMQAHGLGTAWHLVVLTGRVWRTASRCEGCLGVTIAAQPLGDAYLTLSAWENHRALAAFAAGDEHRQAMMAMLDIGGIETSFASWPSDGSRLRACWPQALRRLADAPQASHPRAARRSCMGVGR